MNMKMRPFIRSLVGLAAFAAGAVAVPALGGVFDDSVLILQGTWMRTATDS